MIKHKKNIENYKGDLVSLSKELGDLRYDSLSDFLKELSAKLSKDAEADLKRNRVKLSKNLYEAASQVQEASKAIEKAWEICKPYMESYEN